MGHYVRYSISVRLEDLPEPMQLMLDALAVDSDIAEKLREENPLAYNHNFFDCPRWSSAINCRPGIHKNDNTEYEVNDGVCKLKSDWTQKLGTLDFQLFIDWLRPYVTSNDGPIGFVLSDLSDSVFVAYVKEGKEIFGRRQQVDSFLEYDETLEYFIELMKVARELA